MGRELPRVAFALAAAALFGAAGTSRAAADPDLSAALKALSTTLTSHDVVKTSSGTMMTRDLSASYAASQSSPCVITIHLDATATFTPPGGAFLTETEPGTFYTLPLDKMSTSLSKANQKSSQQLPETNARRGTPSIFSYSGDVILPLAGLTAADPASVSSTKPAPSTPTYATEAAAKAALAALVAAASACATPASK